MKGTFKYNEYKIYCLNIISLAKLSVFQCSNALLRYGSRRVKKGFLKKSRHCPTGCGDGPNPEEQPQAANISSLPETDDTKHGMVQFSSRCVNSVINCIYVHYFSHDLHIYMLISETVFWSVCK